MIDLEAETVFRLAEAPKYLPMGRGGRRVHVSTVFRWAQRGIRGVKLDTIRVGGALHTSTSALQRFAEQLTKLSGNGGNQAGPSPSVRRRAAAAEVELRREGF